MSQLKRLFWRADYHITVNLDHRDYNIMLPREHLEIAEYNGEDIHKAATEFVLDCLEESQAISKDLRKLLYLHVFNTVLRELPLKKERKSWLSKFKSRVKRL